MEFAALMVGPVEETRGGDAGVGVRPEIIAGTVVIRLEAETAADQIASVVRALATRPVDFRKGHDGLAAQVTSVLRKDPFTGTVFVFRSRRLDRLKLLYWDGTGLVMASKRLEDASFTWPDIKDGVMALNHAPFEALFAGLDWRRVKALDVRPPAAAE